MIGPANPYAFPRHPDHPVTELYAEAEAGMTLRDWFAGQAMAGIMSGTLADGSKLDAKGIPQAACAAYALAAAMLAERSKA